MSQYGFSDTTEGSNTEDTTKMENNLLQIKVYFDTLDVKDVAEIADYPLLVKFKD